MNKSTRIVYFLFTAILIGISGCATNTHHFQSRLDNSSGVTVSSLPKPVTMARAAPRISVSARDYVHLGPVEINRMGNKEHYLWLGLASTVDRWPLGEAAPLPTSLLIVADGIPMRLALGDWKAGTMGAEPYEASTTVYRSLQARVAQHQLELLASAGVVQIYLQSENAAPVRYRHWSGTLRDWAQGVGAVATAKRR